MIQVISVDQIFGTPPTFVTPTGAPKFSLSQHRKVRDKTAGQQQRLRTVKKMTIRLTTSKKATMHHPLLQAGHAAFTERVRTAVRTLSCSAPAWAVTSLAFRMPRT